MRRPEVVWILLFFVALATNMAEAFHAANGDVLGDASEVTWAHAVNSRQRLEQELAGPVDFLEADVSLGHVTGNEVGPSQPIMAHPPKMTSDISLDRWLDVVIARNSTKGVKLDFKSIVIVEPSLKILDRHRGKLKFPLWLNADIFPGPINSSIVPVPASEFLSLCQRYFPNATLSLGWTTFWFSTFDSNVCFYGWEHIRTMADTLQCSESLIDKHITFPVRAIFVAMSIVKLSWLLEMFPKSTLTIWSGKHDHLNIMDMKRIRQSFPKSRVFYDIPEPYNEEFHRIKSEALELPPKSPMFFENNWIKVSKSLGSGPIPCRSDTYVTKRTIMFGEGQATVILLKKTFEVTKDQPLRAYGAISFFGNVSSEKSNQDRQVIISVTPVQAFSKNVSSSSVTNSDDDTDLIFTAINSSKLHTFRQSSSNTDPSCHFFHLDTSHQQAFSVWSVPCDQVDSITSNGPKPVQSKGSPRKILVLPSGPLMFGLSFWGEGYAVVHHLEVSGENSYISDAWTMRSASLKQIMGIILLASLAVLLSSLVSIT